MTAKLEILDMLGSFRKEINPQYKLIYLPCSTLSGVAKGTPAGQIKET